MPTYEYACDACKHEFEKFQSMKDAPVKKCPKCGKKKLHRLIGSGSGMIFKGSGFYATDYKKTAAKTDTKPADKTAKPSGGCGCSGGHSCGG